MSLSEIYEKNQASQAKERDAVEALKVKAQEKTCLAADAVLDSVNTGVTEVYVNQRLLDGESRKLQQQCAKFAKQTKQWVALCEGLSKSLNEIGDIENWARVMENDVVAIAATLEAIHSAPPQ